jgi:hypothetical protein
MATMNLSRLADQHSRAFPGKPHSRAAFLANALAALKSSPPLAQDALPLVLFQEPKEGKPMPSNNLPPRGSNGGTGYFVNARGDRFNARDQAPPSTMPSSGSPMAAQYDQEEEDNGTPIDSDLLLSFVQLLSTPETSCIGGPE